MLLRRRALKPAAMHIAAHRSQAAPGLPMPAALRLFHPFPTMLNVAATAGLACVAAGGLPDGGLLVRLLAVMLCAQAAIGVTNDIFDRELDGHAKPWKPLVSGAVSMRTAVVLAVLLIAATAALAGTLGAASWALAMLGLACGLAYDAGLKRTAASALPFMVAIPTLPIWVWTALDRWDDALWWLLPLGALIGLALHLANTLPDIEDDAAHGVRGLAHRLGPARSMLAGWFAFASALALSVALAPALDYDLRFYAPAALFGAGCLILGASASLRRRDAFGHQIAFGALGIGAAVVAVGWLAAVT